MQASYTDFWNPYEKIFPKKRHKSVVKEIGLTNHIERFNNTMRQRVSRLVRKTLPFSKKLDNHIGAVWKGVSQNCKFIANNQGFNFQY